MKSNWPIRLWILSAAIFLFPAFLRAASVNGARLTFASANVRSHGTRDTRLATGDILSAGFILDNGAKARSELTFGNRVIVRLGANTIIKLTDELGAVELREGAILFQIPKGSDAQIATASIAVTSRKATGLLERNRDLYIKLLLLEGEVRVSLNGHVGESIVLEPGQILITSPKAEAIPEPAYFDIARAVKTCQLIRDFSPLPGRELIAEEARKQARLTNGGQYIASNLVIFGRGTLVHLIPPETAEENAPKRTRK